MYALLLSIGYGRTPHFPPDEVGMRLTIARFERVPLLFVPFASVA